MPRVHSTQPDGWRVGTRVKDGHEQPVIRSLGVRCGARGAEVFRANCAVCHTASGAAGGVGPSLEHEKQRKNYDQTVAWIESPDPPMPKLYPAPLTEKDVEDVAAYVQSL